MTDSIDKTEMDELIDSTKNIHACMVDIASQVQSLDNNDPKKTSLEAQLSLISARYKRDMDYLFLVCEHQWESKYDFNNLRYEQCNVCFNVKRV